MATLTCKWCNAVIAPLHYGLSLYWSTDPINMRAICKENPNPDATYRTHIPTNEALFAMRKRNLEKLDESFEG